MVNINKTINFSLSLELLLSRTSTFPRQDKFQIFWYHIIDLLEREGLPLRAPISGPFQMLFVTRS